MIVVFMTCEYPLLLLILGIVDKSKFTFLRRFFFSSNGIANLLCQHAIYIQSFLHMVSCPQLLYFPQIVVL